MAREQHTSQPKDREHGQYQPRKGAQGYSPIVASFGALAVAAIAIVFSSGDKVGPDRAENLAMATGLLAIGVFASFLGSFGLAAIGAERDDTANLSAAMMYIAVPVVIAFVAILGAFEALSAIYVPQSSPLFIFITAVGGWGGSTFTAMSVSDSIAMHPRLWPHELIEWRERQWIQNQNHANRETLLLTGAAALIVGGAGLARAFDRRIDLDIVGMNWFASLGIALAAGGTACCLFRVMHKEDPREQAAIRQLEAWGSVLTIAVYSALLVLVLPAEPPSHGLGGGAGL